MTTVKRFILHTLQSLNYVSPTIKYNSYFLAVVCARTHSCECASTCVDVSVCVFVYVWVRVSRLFSGIYEPRQPACEGVVRWDRRFCAAAGRRDGDGDDDGDDERCAHRKRLTRVCARPDAVPEITELVNRGRGWLLDQNVVKPT